MFLLREALFPSGSEEKLMFVLRPFVLRKMIDFCESDLEGASLLLSTDSLNLWFCAIRKWIAVNEVKTYRKHFRDLFWGRFLLPNEPDVGSIRTRSPKSPFPLRNRPKRVPHLIFFRLRRSNLSRSPADWREVFCHNNADLMYEFDLSIEWYAISPL